jgi:hypothetical protein
MPRVIPKYQSAEQYVEAKTDIWHSSGRYVHRGQRLSITDPIVREEFKHFQHPARPVQPEEVTDA